MLYLTAVSVGGLVAFQAGAQAPSAAWRAMAVPAEVEDAASATARAKGATGAAAVPACRPIAPGIALCLVDSVQRRDVLMHADLNAAGTTEEAAFRSLQDGIEAAWAEAPAQTHSVDGVAGRYFVRAARDGFDAAALLRPELLVELARGPAVVGIPEDGTLVWWNPGNPDFDKMVAVGVRRMAEASAAPVSPRIYQHNGEAWEVWGEVRGVIGLPNPTAPSP